MFIIFGREDKMLSKLGGLTSRNSVSLLLGLSPGSQLLKTQAFPNSDCSRLTQQSSTQLKEGGEGAR